MLEGAFGSTQVLRHTEKEVRSIGWNLSRTAKVKMLGSSWQPMCGTSLVELQPAGTAIIARGKTLMTNVTRAQRGHPSPREPGGRTTYPVQLVVMEMKGGRPEHRRLWLASSSQPRFLGRGQGPLSQINAPERALTRAGPLSSDEHPSNASGHPLPPQVR